jgi:uncharacterized protein YdaU (DUF1376 family)
LTCLEAVVVPCGRKCSKNNRHRAGKGLQGTVNYYPHHIGDYLRDTMHLTILEHGAYRRLLDVYYASEKPLPLETHWVCRLIRADTKEEQEAVQSVLHQFFEKGAAGWRNKRADEEIFKGIKRVKAAKNNGKRGGRRKTQWVSDKQPDGNPVGLQTETQSLAPKTKTKSQINNALSLPEWVPEDAWKAWLEVRPKVRAPNTPRALALALKELEKLKNEGQDPRTVLEMATVKGWRGLFPVKADQPNVSPLYRREGVM